MAAIIVWLLPEPDSPTIATVSPALDVEVDALHRLDGAVERAEADVAGRSIERIGRSAIVSGPSGRARRAGRRR